LTIWINSGCSALFQRSISFYPEKETSILLKIKDFYCLCTNSAKEAPL
jgi:hypothetical protein